MWLNGLPLLFGFLLLILAAALALRARRWQAQTGLPPGDVIYTDSGAWLTNRETLAARDLRLAGRPDYLVEQADGTIIPVELKNGRAPAAPREGHVLQLAAYCLLVEENYGVRPTHGILQYADAAFAIDYTPDLEADLLLLLDEMRAAALEPDLDRDHNDWRRCARCSLNGECVQRLA